MSAANTTCMGSAAAIHLHVWTDPGARARPEQPIRAAARDRALALTLGARAAGITVATDVTGRPRLLGATAGEIDLSSSSTSGWMVVAVAQRCRIGVDIERARADLVDDELAHEVLATDEFEEFKRAADPVRFFCECWTMKEAVLKASGEGLSCHPRRVRVMAPARVDGWRSVVTADMRRWMVTPICGVPGVAMAVASEEAPQGPEIFFNIHRSSAGMSSGESNVIDGVVTQPSS